MGSNAKTYFIATKHAEFAKKEFPKGSTVIDPWRYIPDQKGVKVVRVGENKPTLISILVPTRGRPGDFVRLVKSVYDMATHGNRIEVVAYLDDDDADNYKPRLLGVNYVVGPRILLSECWNRCYENAKGDIFMHCGDDIVFETPGWDTIVRKEFDKSADKLIFVHGDDLGPHGKEFGTHGFVHRRWVETIGYFVPPLFSSDWNDVWLNDVANMIGRRVAVPIVTEHHHYTFGKSHRDKTHAEREERGQRDDVVQLFKDTQKERNHDAALLRAAMQ